MAGHFVGETQDMQIMHNGILIKRGSYHGEWMSEIIQKLRGHHEPQEEKVFAEILTHIDDGAVMVELGSFWAYYSMWFQQQIPDAKSIMIEPNSSKLEVGKDHFRINNFQGKFLQGFVGGEPKLVSTFIDWDGQESQIEQITIDSLMQKQGLDSIDILHADVQGAEYDMLKGSVNALMNNKIKYFFISTHGHQHRRCLRYLKKFGYQIVAQHTVLGSYSGDGLIVARSGSTTGPDNVPISKRRINFLQYLRYELAGLKYHLLQFFKYKKNQ
jgi:FkbM family methyltransferase